MHPFTIYGAASVTKTHVTYIDPLNEPIAHTFPMFSEEVIDESDILPVLRHRNRSAMLSGSKTRFMVWENKHCKRDRNRRAQYDRSKFRTAKRKQA